jgi:hypothetical protein
MIKEKQVDFRINNNMLKYYSEKLNMILVVGQIIKVDVNKLSVGSHCKITLICDKCGREKIMEYKTYYKMSNGGKEKCYCQKCSGEKHQQSMLNKYGYKHALQIEKFRDKSKTTLFKNYGVTVPIQSKIIRDRFTKTMLERYNVKNALENKEILNSMKNKLFNDYGMYYVETEEFKIQSKLTCLDKYGVENASQTEEFQRKKIETCIKKYGVKHHFQNIDIFHKLLISSCKMKKYKETDLYYQGTYEEDFLILCEKLNILKLVERGCSIKYIMNDKNLIYFPDFFIKKWNMLIEIKSSYWYNEHKDKNLIKENTCKQLGFDYFLILDKNYDDFLSKIEL